MIRVDPCSLGDAERVARRGSPRRGTPQLTRLAPNTRPVVHTASDDSMEDD